MTERLYYDDAYLWQFDAAVTSGKNGKRPGEWEVTLDRSAFYPTSGGQPFDTGMLTFGKVKARVTDVEVDAEGEVIHTVDKEIPAGTAVHGEIDGARRTDHMEQHGGEHMLAGAIWEKLGGTTIGLHLGQTESSIDVAMPDERTHLTEEEILLLENTVNERIRLDAPIRCARTVRVQGKDVKGPELETLALLGGNLCNNDLQKILDWNYELDELGMDTITTANTIAYAMEANEQGLWDNGLKFGSTDDLSAMFADIACRRGLGDELAEGSRRLSEKYGGREFAMHSKGLELAAYEPRRAVGQGLGYAVSNRGGCHLNGGYLVIMEGLGLNMDQQTPKAKADLAMLLQDLMETISASGQCLFTSYAILPGFLLTKPDGAITRLVNGAAPHIGGLLRVLNRYPRIAALHLPVFHHTRMIRYATGMPMDLGRYLAIGERGYTMERYINCKFGITAADDRLPRRLTDVPQDPRDPKTKVPLEEMKKTYYKARGWDKNGIPTEATLRRLKIK